jgi:curli biogenesis system outer membrane secretion channel CsgG
MGPEAWARDSRDSRPAVKRLTVSQTPGSREEGSEPERPRDRRLKKRLAVMDVELGRSGTRAGDTNGSGPSLPLPAGFARGTTRLLTAALARSGRFVVLEHEALRDVQEEFPMEESNLPTLEGVMSAGRALGAQYLLHGTITELTYRRTSSVRDSAPGRATAGQDTARVALRVRLFNTATGQLSATVRCEGRAWMPGAAGNGRRGQSTFGSAAFNTSPLGEATREAVTQAVDGIVEYLEAYAWGGRPRPAAAPGKIAYAPDLIRARRRTPVPRP